MGTMTKLLDEAVAQARDSPEEQQDELDTSKNCAPERVRIGFEAGAGCRAVFVCSGMSVSGWGRLSSVGQAGMNCCRVSQTARRML